jgi:hypothetical protein
MMHHAAREMASVAYDNPLSKASKTALFVGAAIAAVGIGALIYYKSNPLTVTGLQPTGRDFNPSTAIDVTGSVIVKVGQSLHIAWAGAPWAQQATTSDATVVTPCAPAVVNGPACDTVGFVAIAPGKATITGYYFGSGSNIVSVSVDVTVTA